MTITDRTVLGVACFAFGLWIGAAYDFDGAWFWIARLALNLIGPALVGYMILRRLPLIKDAYTSGYRRGRRDGQFWLAEMGLDIEPDLHENEKDGD